MGKIILIIKSFGTIMLHIGKTRLNRQMKKKMLQIGHRMIKILKLILKT